jgi:hypothetical protein
LEACNQETSIRKRRFQIAGSPTTSFLLIYELRFILQSNCDLLFYKTYRRNSSEYYFEKEPITISGSVSKIILLPF